MASIYGKQPGSNWSDVSTNNDGISLGGKYQSLVDKNPYRNQTYQKSPWQNFLSALGFRTEADAWQENMSVQASEYDAAIAQKQYDEQYNDPLAQVERMRNAGLNPDIDGGSNISSGQAASLGEDPSTPMATSGDAPQLLQFANTVMSSFTSAIGMVGTFQGIRRNALQNRVLSIQGDADLQDLAKKMFPYFLPDSAEGQVEENGTEHSWQDLALTQAKIFSRNMSKKEQQKFLNYSQAFWNSGPGKGEAYESWAKKMKAEKGYYSEKNEFYDVDPEVMDKIYKHLGAARESITKLNLAAEGQKASTEIAEGKLAQDIADSTSGNLVGQARTDEAKAKSADAQIRQVLRGTIRDLLKDLDSDPSWFAQLFKTILSVAAFIYM